MVDTGEPTRIKRPGQQAVAVKVTRSGARRLYTRQLRTFHVAVILFLGTCFSIGPVNGVGSHRTAATAAGVIFGVSLLACIAVLRRGIEITPDLVTVRGLLTTRRIPAATIARFEPPPTYGKWWRPGLRIVLTDGRIRTRGAFTNTPVDGGRSGTPETNELNLWLALRSPDATSTADTLPDQREVDRYSLFIWRSWILLLRVFAMMCLAVVVAAMTDPTFDWACEAQDWHGASLMGLHPVGLQQDPGVRAAGG
jgi:hypothetical protein